VKPSDGDEAPDSIIHHGRDGRATDQALFQMQHGAYLPHWTHDRASQCQ
jgi:hypothetical protein